MYVCIYIYIYIYIYTLIANSHCSTAENNIHCKAIIFQLKKNPMVNHNGKNIKKTVCVYIYVCIYIYN